MFSKKIIRFSQEDISSSDDALKYLSSLLIKSGVVKETFTDAVISRENDFPTGLPFKPFGVAIPHTDPEHVNIPQVAVLTLLEPIFFKEMANSEVSVPVKTIFMLALKKPHAQLEMLQKLISLFQDENIMKEISNFSDSEEEVENFIKLLKKNNIY